jgi:hypothetical protein
MAEETGIKPSLSERMIWKNYLEDVLKELEAEKGKKKSK